MGMAKIRKGDKVAVITGKDKGKQGEVLKVITDKQRVIVSGVNMATIHVKPSYTSPNGGIEKKERSLHISNVLHVDPKDNKPTKVGFKIMKDGNKVRFAKRSGEVIDN